MTNDGLTRSGTGCFISVNNSERQRVKFRFSITFYRPLYSKVRCTRAQWQKLDMSDTVYDHGYSFYDKILGY